MTLENLSKQELIEQLESQSHQIDRLREQLALEQERTRQYLYEARLLDFVLDPVLSSDADFRILTWNKAAEEFYGWTEQEVIGQDAIQLFQTAYRDGENSESALNHFHQQGTWRGEVIHLRKDGSHAIMMATTSRINDDDGNLVGYVTILRDLSESIQAKQALLESEERYRIISEIMSDYAYYYRLDEEGNWYRVWTTLDAFKRLTGYERTEVDGTYGLYHPNEVEQVKEDVARTLAGEDTEREYQIITKEGQTKWLYVIRRALWDDKQQRVIGFYGVGKDVTARHLANERLAAYNREQDRMQVLQDFIRDASHDLKTPLSTINTSIYLLRKYMTTDKQLQQLIKLESHVERLSNLIDDMFDMSRLDLIDSLDRRDLNLIPSLNDAVLSHQFTANAKQITLINNTSVDELTVYADISALQQVFNNIIENAILYTPEEGHIVVTGYIDGDGVTVTIKDTGMGISDDELPYIFDRFYRGDKARSTSTSASTGLGLSIARKIMALHGGTIEVESQVGVGSCFYIKFPSRR